MHLAAWAVAALAGNLLQLWPPIGIAVLAVGGSLYFVIARHDERAKRPPTRQLIHDLVHGIIDVTAGVALSRIGSVSVWIPSARGDLQLWCAAFDKYPPFGGDQVRGPRAGCALWGAYAGRHVSLESFALASSSITAATRFAVPLCDTLDRV